MPNPDNQLEPLASPSWLARKGKIVILGALGIVVLIATGLALRWLRPSTPSTNTTNQTTNTVTGTTPTNYARPTFQRSTVTNTATALPDSYTPPTTQQLQQAITNLSH